MGREDDPPVRRRQTKPAYLAVLDKPPVKPNGKRFNRDKWKLMYYNHGRWMGRWSRFLLSRLKLYDPPSLDDVTNQAGILCRDFIYSRLKRQSLLSVKLELHPSPARGSEVAMEIHTLSTELEKQYPNLYKNICRQLNIVMSSEHIVRSTFVSLSNAMFNGSFISWGRIIALFLIAGTLSAECVQQGHPEFVRHIVDSFREVTRKHLAQWISQHGGWSDITRVFRVTRETSTLWAVTGIGAVLGCVITLVSTLTL